jgi:hypothetical protein
MRAFEERPDIGAPMAANLTGEFRLQIGEPDVIGPTLRADYYRMRALVIAEQTTAGRRGSGIRRKVVSQRQANCEVERDANSDRNAGCIHLSPLVRARLLSICWTAQPAGELSH